MNEVFNLELDNGVIHKSKDYSVILDLINFYRNFKSKVKMKFYITGGIYDE